MGKLTQTLLEFAKASGTPGGLEINLLRIDEIILGLPSEINKLNSAYTVKLEFENMPEEEEKLLVFGNETLLLTATKNIVINACKYSENHNAVVKLTVKNHHIQIEVSDTGQGIPKEQLEHIFQPFYRVDETRTTGGFGLGLSLAERIIKLHKGTISVESEEGVGTRFIISLPAAHLLKGF
jgi:signal transduction histidine kinase